MRSTVHSWVNSQTPRQVSARVWRCQSELALRWREACRHSSDSVQWGIGWLYTGEDLQREREKPSRWDPSAPRSSATGSSWYSSETCCSLGSPEVTREQRLAGAGAGGWTGLLKTVFSSVSWGPMLGSSQWQMGEILFGSSVKLGFVKKKKKKSS